MTRSRKVTKRLVPEDAAMLAAHAQQQLETERARIARRLHGDVAGMLAAARMDLSRMANRAGVEGELREQVLRVDQILDAVIQNARSEMERLHPALLDHFGLSAALRHLIEQACRTAAAEYTLELPEFTDAGLSSPVALAAYRVVECLLLGLTLRRVNVRLREAGAGLQLGVELEGMVLQAREGDRDLLVLRAWLEALGASWNETHRGVVDVIELTLPRVEKAAATRTAAAS